MKGRKQEDLAYFVPAPYFLFTVFWPHSSVAPATARQPSPALAPLGSQDILSFKLQGWKCLLPLAGPWTFNILFGFIYPINDSFIKVLSMKAYEWNSAFRLPIVWQQWVDLVLCTLKGMVEIRDAFWVNTWDSVCVCVCRPCSGLEPDLEIFHNLRSNPCILVTWFNPQTCEMETIWRNVYGLAHCGSSTNTYSRVGVEKSSWVLILYSYYSKEKL